MLFHKRRPVTPIQFSMINRIIDVVQRFNHLSIMLDADMSWKTHVPMVRNKLSRVNGILHRLKYIYPQSILNTLYKSVFVPHINYGSLFWGHAGGAIDKIKNKAVSSYVKSSKKLNNCEMLDLNRYNFLPLTPSSN